MMELSLYDMSTAHRCSYEQMSLAEMLEVQGHPVSEEQAWALCYQLCRMLSHQSGEQTRKTAVSPAAEAVLFSRDGGVSLRQSNSGDTGNSCVIETEEQAVEFVGRLVYLSLDWGLETQVERELSETLEILVCQMTKVNLGHRQPICSIADVIHVCKERLYDPSQAAKHYRSVCSGLFSHTAELCQYLQIVQQSRKVSSWRDLVDELSRGVLLRPLAKRLTVSKCPQPAETPPFNQLLRDIQFRRYTLRKVQLTDVGDGQRKPDPHQTLLEFIRSRPKLRPASERRIGLKPKEQISLHELLMEEIRSTDRCKRLAHNTESSYKHGLTINGEAEERSFLKSAPHRIRSDEAVGSGSDAQDASFTDFTLCAGKRRTRSFASNRDLFKVVKSSNRGSVLTTIVDVMKMHSSEEQGDVKDLSCERYGDWRVCSCCAMRSLYFTWHNVCSVCRRVVCPGCCLEMRLPSKRCVNLPLSFFKQIVMKDGEQSQRNFWSERWSWNSVWIPLVLVSSGSSSTSLHTLATRDWYSQDICVRCQKDLLQACDSLLSSCPVTDSQEI
ncbi:protein spire homolog 1 isoform X2 [Sinocyclocheilus rhinocerous]|uniref:protein spire homolog 1 isoform X2 n=1 Tax=Sinocyclocheilus rhinocerous TaxID=307959 RepID=UPI0007B842CE|nr:PREDICTED: protein spire homolog 1-like isoform X2 [Sinocyclocheilus rhinocerous]